MPDFFHLTSISSPAVAAYPPGATFGPRELADYELVWMMEGNAQYILNGSVMSAPEGSFILCLPGCVDAFRWDTKRHTRHGFCHFYFDIISSDVPHSSTWPTIRYGSDLAVLEPSFNHLLTLDGIRDRSRLESTITFILTEFILGPQGQNSPTSSLPDSVNRVIKYVKGRLDIEPDAKITLDDMANIAYCSKEHLCRQFTSSVGISPAEYVRRAKLSSAATMLLRSNYSIAEIALLFGFSNPSHFTKRFAEQYGESPKQYRKKSEPLSPGLLEV
jgi:AraC-like DNA-binding protein